MPYLYKQSESIRSAQQACSSVLKLAELSWANLDTGHSKALSGLSPSAPKPDPPTLGGWIDVHPLNLPLGLYLL